MNNVPAIPEPSALTLAEARDVCVSVINWANECDDVEMVVATKKAFQVVAEYLRLNDASREAEATMRMLEVRIGSLLGPAERGGDMRRPEHLTHEVDALTYNQRHQFRQMAAHPEIVEQVVEQSTEQAPPSRAKVLAAIKELDRVAKQAAVEQAEWDAGIAEQREWAAGFKAKDGDDWRRRDEAEGATLSFIHDAKAFLGRITPDDLGYALTTGFDHVANRLRSDLTSVLEQLDDYRKVL